MKKIYLISLFLTTFASLFSQQMIHDLNRNNTDTPADFRNSSSDSRELVSDWYNYGQTIYDLGGDVNYFRNNIFPDSTVLVQFSDGMGYTFKHSIGQVFDPTSFYYETADLVPVAENVSYTVDSLAIPYRYFRFQNEAPDTVIVQVYTQPDITLVADPGWDLDYDISYANIDYDFENRIGAGAIQTFTYLLTDEDVATESANFLYFPINITIPAGEKFAATITYFPGNPYNVNDTIDAYIDPAPSNPINSFIVYEFRDNDIINEPLYYNNEVVAINDTRYNLNSIGWDAQYIPGTAWIGGIYHADMYFHISFDNDAIGLNENSSLSDLTVYPNPTNGLINISYNHKITNTKVLDLSGRTILNENGNNVTSIDLGKIANGTYILQIMDVDGNLMNKTFSKK